MLPYFDQIQGIPTPDLYTLTFSGDDMIPTGAILLWAGTIATIPTGYVLCNGSNGTPDLRNRFVVCANADSAGQAMTTLTGAPTQSGGSISHTHSITDPGHTHEIPLNEIVLEGPGVSMPSNITDDSTTGITVDSVSAPQPYFALAYIMKT